MLGKRSLLLAGIFAITLTGCASMTSSKEELQNVGENEGVVYGSFVINVEKGEGNEPVWAFLKGQKAGDATYDIMISSSGLNPFKLSYIIRARPEKEEVFIKKLPAGQYRVEKIAKEGFTTLELPLEDVYFRVVPSQTTYVGKLTVQFTNRIMVGSPVSVIVGNAQQETSESLKGEYGPSLSRVVTGLMTAGYRP